MSTHAGGSTRLYPNARYRQIPYDLVRELTLSVLGIGALVLILSVIFSTPDVPPLSAKQVVYQDPLLLVQTELRELGGQSSIALYGPPYNHQNGSLQGFGWFSPQSWAGVQLPLDTAKVDVIKPLRLVAIIDPVLKGALQTWEKASTIKQTVWIHNNEKALKASSIVDNQIILPNSMRDAYGPVPEMSNAYLKLAKTGLLEAAIDGEDGSAPLINRTKSILLFEMHVDAAYATQFNLLGQDWGVIQETGNYPGAVWLWYYTLLYQIPPYNTSPSADLLVVLTVILTTGILLFIPFIPGLRSIPRWLGIYKLIWRSYYREQRQKGRTTS